jgi:hypothetical protein
MLWIKYKFALELWQNVNIRYLPLNGHNVFLKTKMSFLSLTK